MVSFKKKWNAFPTVFMGASLFQTLKLNDDKVTCLRHFTIIPRNFSLLFFLKVCKSIELNKWHLTDVTEWHLNQT